MAPTSWRQEAAYACRKTCLAKLAFINYDAAVLDSVGPRERIIAMLRGP